MPGGVAFGQRHYVECALNVGQDGGVVARDVGDEVGLGVGRNDDHWHSEARQIEGPAYGSNCTVVRGAVVGIGALAGEIAIIGRRNHKGCGVVIETPAFVVGEDEDGILPGIALHQRIDDRLHIGCAALDVVVGMLVESAGAGGAVNENDLRQS